MTGIIDTQTYTGTLALDPSLYSLRENESVFLKQLTKIDDDEKLKEHILAVQREAFEVMTPWLLSHKELLISFFRFIRIHASKGLDS